MKRIIFVLVFLSALSLSVSAQVNRSFGISIGTTFGTYAGADFGSTYAFTFPQSRYDNSYNYNNYYYGDYHDGRDMYSPIILDLGMDFYVNNYAAVNLESSFIWHYAGKPARDYETGIVNGNDYIDKWDNAELFTVPLFINVKLFPFGRQKSAFYITGGYGLQYTSESVDRIREEYGYNYEYPDYSYLIGYSSSKKWLNGIKAGIGLQFPVSPYATAEAEFKVTNFFPKRSISSPLAMNTTTNITFIGLTTKIYFNF